MIVMAKNKRPLDGLIVPPRGPRTERLPAGIHADQDGKPNRQRTRGQAKRAAIENEDQ